MFPIPHPRIFVSGVFCAACAVIVAAPPAAASPVAEAIAAQVDIENYQHYLEDLLFTHLGDDRGFGPQHDLARDNIVDVLSSFGLSVELEPFLYAGNTYYNVVATQIGTEFPDQIHVIGAHFDSVNNPGADDNGTGTAIVMEVARILSRHRPARTIKYIAFDREEQGLKGSYAYVAQHTDLDIVMALVTDMVGHDAGFYAMDIYGKPASSYVVNGVADAIDTYGDGLGAFVNLGSYAFSDHWPFEAAGIPACVVIERCYSCNPYYHTPNDAVDVEPGYISYPMLEDLLHAVVGYLVDEIHVSLYGDGDDDADLDMLDFAGFQCCFGTTDDPDCVTYDFDADGVVDLADYAGFQAAMTGPLPGQHP